MRVPLPPWALHFNPRSPRGGATGVYRLGLKLHRISIHAPHEGERQNLITLDGITPLISIHAPHEGERQRSCEKRVAWI